MSLYATERLRDPFALDAVVVNDPTARNLGVRLHETASGYQRMWWKQAHQQLKAAVEDGWRSHPFVWASTPGADRVAHVEPADFSTLTVHFPVGVSSYAELISRPGLRAICTVDRNSGRFTNVSFRNRP